MNQIKLIVLVTTLASCLHAMNQAGSQLAENRASSRRRRETPGTEADDKSAKMKVLTPVHSSRERRRSEAKFRGQKPLPKQLGTSQVLTINWTNAILLLLVKLLMVGTTLLKSFAFPLPIGRTTKAFGEFGLPEYSISHWKNLLGQDELCQIRNVFCRDNHDAFTLIKRFSKVYGICGGEINCDLKMR